MQEVSASLSGVYELITVAATDGTLAADVRPLVRLSVSVLVEEDGKRERGSSGGGGRFVMTISSPPVRATCGPMPGERSGAHGAGQPLGGRRPCGMLPVVLGAGWPGVLLHEAVGHGLEGDFNRRGTSVFSGHMGN